MTSVLEDTNMFGSSTQNIYNLDSEIIHQLIMQK